MAYFWMKKSAGSHAEDRHLAFSSASAPRLGTHQIEVSARLCVIELRFVLFFDPVATGYYGLGLPLSPSCWCPPLCILMMVGAHSRPGLA